MQATDDKNFQTNRGFNGSIVPAIGFTSGYDFIDSIGMMFQGTYGGFKTSQVGNGTANFPFETARQHIVNLALTVRYTFLTGWEKQPTVIKILPYVKAGAAGRLLWVNAASDGNDFMTYGAGVAVGGGLELLLFDNVMFGIDLTENLMFMQDDYATVGGARTKVYDGGFRPNFQLLGMVGYHF
jgi:hypothetical protein